MIYVLSGGGTGATLVITGVAGDTCTITKDGKSKSKMFDSFGKATFKGLDTGTWTVTMTNASGDTATRTVTVNADYTLTISYFSATISVTYPATSKCVIKNSSGTTVASNTNTGSSAKTWAATVDASGTYTVTATSTSDSSKTSTSTVSITADGQTKTVTLLYELVLWNNGSVNEDVTGGWDGNQASASLGDDYEKYLSNGSFGYYGTASVTKNKVDVTKYNTLIFNVVSFTSADPVATLGISNRTSSPAGDAIATVTATKSQTYPTELSVDVSAVSGEYYVFIYADGYFDNSGVAHTCGITVNNVKLI